jgi:hypothetical protein
MNHLIMVLKFWIVLFWLVVLKGAYLLVTDCGNCHALGWFGLTLYGSVAVTVLYFAAVLTKSFWRLK